MAKPIKYLNYEVHQGGNLVSSGSVPSIIALSGVDKSYNLGGAWLWHTVSQLTTLTLSDGVDTVIHYSDRVSEVWRNYNTHVLHSNIDTTW